MSLEETVFAIQRPRYLVEEYVELIKEFGIIKDYTAWSRKANLYLAQSQNTPAVPTHTPPGPSTLFPAARRAP